MTKLFYLLLLNCVTSFLQSQESALCFLLCFLRWFPLDTKWNPWTLINMTYVPLPSCYCPSPSHDGDFSLCQMCPFHFWHHPSTSPDMAIFVQPDIAFLLQSDTALLYHPNVVLFLIQSVPRNSRVMFNWNLFQLTHSIQDIAMQTWFCQYNLQSYTLNLSLSKEWASTLWNQTIFCITTFLDV